MQSEEVKQLIEELKFDDNHVLSDDDAVKLFDVLFADVDTLEDNEAKIGSYRLISLFSFCLLNNYGLIPEFCHSFSDLINEI